MSNHMLTHEIHDAQGTCIRIVTWHQQSEHGDWRGALTRPTYARDGRQVVHVCGEAYASSEEAVLSRCITMARLLLGLPLPGTGTIH